MHVVLADRMFTVVDGATRGSRVRSVYGDTSGCLFSHRTKKCHLGAGFRRRGFSLKEVFKFTCKRGRGKTMFSRVTIVCNGTLCGGNCTGRKRGILRALLSTTVSFRGDEVCPKVPRCFSGRKEKLCTCLANTTD